MKFDFMNVIEIWFMYNSSISAMASLSLNGNKRNLNLVILNYVTTCQFQFEVVYYLILDISNGVNSAQLSSNDGVVCSLSSGVMEIRSEYSSRFMALSQSNAAYSESRDVRNVASQSSRLMLLDIGVRSKSSNSTSQQLDNVVPAGNSLWYIIMILIGVAFVLGLLVVIVLLFIIAFKKLKRRNKISEAPFETHIHGDPIGLWN
ncbi:hypothetical protein AKO1_007966 [Acrasis kona]|uniref:Uncharacterized protein n=1 Tax=Acrasis kona TaxID=1008807 RepID=A0AAW2YNP4_9EUKA